MKYLGIDFGEKAIGLAVSDALGTIAFPRDIILNDANAQDLIADIVADEKIGGIVFGDTRTIGGDANIITPRAEEFAKKLSEHGVPVKIVSEAWSSVEASRYAPKGSERDDSAAAAIILQRYLDMRKS